MGIGTAFLTRLRHAIALEESRGVDVDPMKLAKELIRQERTRLRKAGSIGRGTAAEMLNRERYARRKAQELAASLLGPRRNRPPPKDLLVAQFRESPLLDKILPGRHQEWVPALTRDPYVSAEIELNGFSFLDNPEATLSAIKTLARIGCSSVNARLHFNDPTCTDIGAYLVLGEIWPVLSPFFSGGECHPRPKRLWRQLVSGV